MNPTKLLVLGVVRIFQPVHGYHVRRELLSWQVDRWANVKPGSIYHALQRLDTDGLIEVVEAGGEDTPRGQSKTSYRLTDEGDTEFRALLHEHLWEVEPGDPTGLMAALAFVPSIDRNELLAALEHRVAALEGYLEGSAFARQGITASTTTPDHVLEFFLVGEERARGELVWSRAFAGRLRAGAYALRGEPGSIHESVEELDNGPAL